MSRQKYFWTPEQDDFIRAHYNPTVWGRAKAIATYLGVPKWVVKKRAGALDLSRVKDSPWSPTDIAYLEANFHQVATKEIAKRLGRSVTAVKLKAKRLGYRKHGEGYTMNSLAQAFGVDRHWVSDRVRAGKIAASPRSTERTPQQGGDSYFITDKAVVRFLQKHTFEVDLRKVDRLWFLDLVHDALNSR